jgi:hypothetical protein
LWAKVFAQSSTAAINGVGFLYRVILFRQFVGAVTFELATLDLLSYAATAFQRN